MAYDAIDWKYKIAKHGKGFAIKMSLVSSILFIGGFSAFLGCGIRTISAKPIPSANIQTLDLGWLNFNAQPIQKLISYMVPNGVIQLIDGEIIIPPIMNYQVFLDFSIQNKDALEMIRDIGVPKQTYGTIPNNQIQTTPITSDQRILLDSWILASSYHMGASSGVAFWAIGTSLFIGIFVFLMYIKINKQKLIQHIETVNNN